MNYEIETRSDFLTGAYLIIKIPENELDTNALDTIQYDCPEFILPFHYKNTNGHIEFTYKVGMQSRLQYFSGELTPKEYSELWQSLLRPLLECGDWFMNPCSFILNSEYLYYDKIKNAVSYVYIPSVCGCSGYDAFFEMAVDVSKIMTVSDAVLENKVLRSIIENFNPVEFLKMLKEHVSENDGSQSIETAQNELDKPEKRSESDENSSDPIMIESLKSISNTGEDIFIDLKAAIETENGKKETGGYRIFSGRSRKKKSLQKSSPEPEYKQELLSYQRSTEVKQTEIINITQNTAIISGGPGLRYVGRAHLPPAIHILIAEGEMFTIGRFDATIGKQQSSFEFDKKTKAVSRRHAVIERDANGYKIIDLASSAGTFVNDKKIPPNTPYGLETGCRVSFGNSGADYVWEVS